LSIQLSSELVTESADSANEKIGDEEETMSDESSVAGIPGSATTVARLLSVYAPAEVSSKLGFVPI
jgi:hypothetical protein